MNLIKPKLVDYDLIKFPKKNNIKKKKIIKQDNTKFYLNAFVIIILFFGGYALYYRMINKEKKRVELEENILFLESYVNNSLKDIKDNISSENEHK